MSQKSFSAIEREAVWIAHGKKCAYTGEVLTVDALHIDHIIPEKFLETPEQLKELKSRLGLAEDFGINGWENLVPCKQSANLRKGDVLFEDSRMHYFLHIARGKKENVLAQIRKIETSQNRGKAVIKIQQAVEAKHITPSEIATLLEQYNSHPEQIVTLLEALELKDQQPLNEVQVEQIAELKSAPIRFGQNDHIDSLELRNDKGERREVRSCNDYEGAIRDGYFAYTTYEIKMSVYFEHQCGLLNAISNSKMPEESYISQPHRGITDLSLIPFSLFPNIGDSEIEIDEAKSYQDVIDDGNLFIKRVTHNSITIEDEEMGQYLGSRLTG
jgi:hypothetical protein